MRKMSFYLVLGAAFLMMSGIAFAEEGDASFGIGIKGWVNDFKFGVKDTTTGQTDSIKTKNTALMIGPSAKFSYKKFFTGVTYLTTASDYEFKEIPGTKISRNDLDVLMGVMFVPQFGIVGGYKGIFIDVKNANERNKNGGVLGFTTNYALPFEAVRLAFFGNFAGLYLNEKIKYELGGSESHNFYGFGAEAGMAYNIVAGLSASLGYKFQGLYSIKKKDEDSTSSENYKGVTFGIDYRF